MQWVYERGKSSDIVHKKATKKIVEDEAEKGLLNYIKGL